MENEVINNKIESLRKLKYINEDIEERMIKAVGFRNIAVHTYQNIDWEIVYSIVTKKLSDFVEFVKQIDEH